MPLIRRNLSSSARLKLQAAVCALALAGGLPAISHAQQPAPPARAGIPDRFSPTPGLKGKTVERIDILGNRTVSSSSIRNVIRSRVGEPYDPATVEEDYQRIFRELRKFSNVEARVEPTDTGGVVVVFLVSEQKQVNTITFRGNQKVDELTLRAAIEVRAGEAIDPFRISLAKNAIEGIYREKNYPFARVTIPQEPLRERGDLLFELVEGPNVRIRKVSFKNASPRHAGLTFDTDKLKSQIKTRSWIFILNPGRYDPEAIDEDLGALRKFYESKGFFDARIGRKIIWSPDLTEAQVEFLIDEGPRYIIDRISFEGLGVVAERQLRESMKLTEGRPFDQETVIRDVRSMVRVYSPFGFIFDPQSDDPDYLRIDPKPVFLERTGRVELVYHIHEGKPFHVGQIYVKGNYKSQDKLALREIRIATGDMYDSGKVQDALERLRGTPYFDSVSITPIGSDPDSRALLIEVGEGKTASFNIGAGVNSNGGVGGNITFEQRNFDIANIPDSWKDLFTDRSFTGAGQRLRISIEPGTKATNASIAFSEPWLLDQPYSFSSEAYLRARKREHYDDQRLGGRFSFGHRFDYTWSGAVSFRGEDVRIDNIDDPPLRAPEYLESEGHSTLTSIGLQLKRNTVNPGALPFRGSDFTATAEVYGALGGDFSFQKFTLGWDRYFLLSEDLTERKTTLALHANAGYITGDSVFFERFYAGGIGSVRGFKFRGISPRGGLDDDPVGGDFLATGTAEVNFPLMGESLRGVIFTDVGTVERGFELGDIRSSVGAGVRIVLPILGQAPIAIDFGFPITKGRDDDTQVLSFSFGFVQ